MLIDRWRSLQHRVRIALSEIRRAVEGRPLRLPQGLEEDADTSELDELSDASSDSEALA